MRRLTVFNQVSLDGYFTDRNGDMSWAHKDDAEWNAFAAENATGQGIVEEYEAGQERFGRGNTKDEKRVWS